MTTSLHRRLDAALADGVIIDCETTGLDPSDARIIEFAALQLHDGQPVAEFHTLVDPGRPVPEEITDITGITSGDLDGRPAFADIIGTVTSLIEGRTVVGHNIDFDMAFVSAECDRSGDSAPLPSADVLCTAASARTLIPREQVGRYRLGTLAEVLGLSHRPTHRAVDDARATVDLLTYLRDISR
ncbi:3'-5' exonuclease [Corynebacterium sp.]|uniref:3'-5' exonuclease n=1 Tax=Corynebacterium sp. TaxID=1720 RepID=UPI0025C08B6F|nr:3'-5' exonuclease [Corynebacterium sp.]